MDEEIAENKRRARRIAALFALPLPIIILIVASLLSAPLVGLLVALAVGGVSGWLLLTRPAALLVGETGARPAGVAEFARYHNLVDGLCVSWGLPKPELRVVDDPSLNAAASGVDPDHAVLVVTTGLLDTLDRIELEGVLAHELAHVKNLDTLPATVAAATIGRMTRPAFAPLAGLLPGLWRWALPREVEQAADFSGVRMTRFPPGLIAAFDKLDTASTAVSGASRATAHQWIAWPVDAARRPGEAADLDERFESRPAITERIEFLREL